MNDDTISRQAAIDALVGITMFETEHEIMQRVNASVQDEQGWLGAVAECLDEIEDLPSVQPERKPGKWIYGEDEYGIDGYHCDECGFFVPWDYTHKFINYIEDYNFCPHCGADMRGDKDAVD